MNVTGASYDAEAADELEYEEARRAYMREYRRRRREAGNPIKDRPAAVGMDSAVCGYRSEEYNPDTEQMEVKVCTRSPHVFEGMEEIDPRGLHGEVCLDEHHVRYVLPHCKRHMRDAVVQARISRDGVAECDMCKDMHSPTIFMVEQAWMAPLFRIVFGPEFAENKVWLECRWCWNDVERLHLSDRIGRTVPEMFTVKRSGFRPLLDRVRVFMRYAHEFRRCGLRHSERVDSVFFNAETQLCPTIGSRYARSAPNSSRDRRKRREPDAHAALRKRLARQFVVRHFDGRCPGCDAEVGRWIIKWWEDTATCAKCYYGGIIRPFLRQVLPWDVAALDEFGPRVEAWDIEEWRELMLRRRGEAH